MKKALLLFLAISVSISVMAQLQRSLPENVQAHPQAVLLPEVTPVLVRGNVTQDFESYTDFSLVFTPWTTIDVDGSPTYRITDYDFLHSQEPMAFIAFNPASTTPSLSGDSYIQPHSGTKFAACFAATTPPNNDWMISPQIELGANGHLKFWVKSYTNTYGLEKYKVGVSTTTPQPGSFTIISGTTPLEAPATAWQQKDFDLSAYSGQQIYIGIQCVSSDAFIFMLDDMEITSESTTGATLTGNVSNAINGHPVQNALVSIEGLTDYTDELGNYTITGIPAGILKADFSATPISGNANLAVQFTDLSAENTHTVTASATGYTTYTNNSVVISQGGSLELQISLSPTLASGQYRFVLTWGELPDDLDSHLKTPEIGGISYHVWFGDYGSVSSPPFDTLDIDDTESFGPETITIYDLQPGEYKYFIKNFSETPDITTSNAVVQIYDQSGLLHTLQVPASGTGLFWNVCTFNGSNGNINIINQVTDIEPGGPTLLNPDQIKKVTIPVNRTISSWSWIFGDGGTSNVQNPTHNYTANGSYNVSLTVSDGTNNDTETKNAFILVGPAGISEAAWEKDVIIFPNPVKDQLNINSGIRIQSVAIFDMNGLQKMKAENCGLNYSINLAKYSEGTYILRIITDKGSMQRKVSIKR